MATRGFVLAAPHSNAGKTTVTLALLRAFHNLGLSVAGAKSGPDYIDPAFHAAATGKVAFNLDAWAMRPDAIRARAAAIDADLLVVEGAMGVLDGAGRSGTGSAADLAEVLDLPVVLVIDASKQAHSVTLSAVGLRAQRPNIRLAGVILNQLRSRRHAQMAAAALAAQDIPLLGAVPHDDWLKLPDRHLGLVQAGEHKDLNRFLDQAAAIVGTACNMGGLLGAADGIAKTGVPHSIPPLGQRIAVAYDAAFGFAYPHLFADWSAAGASIHTFSPLDDDIPDTDADAIFLPGGYPELHAGTLSAARRFREAMQVAAAKGTTIYGECGGYMALGETLSDAAGKQHTMLGLLPLRTSFAQRKLNLGYRRLHPIGGAPFENPLMAHEFHYATIVEESRAGRLFEATDADGASVPDMGLLRNNVSGSFAHIIAPQ